MHTQNVQFCLRFDEKLAEKAEPTCVGDTYRSPFESMVKIISRG